MKDLRKEHGAEDKLHWNKSLYIKIVISYLCSEAIALVLAIHK